MTNKRDQDLTAAEIEPSTDKILAIDIDRISPNPFQPRRDISKEKIDELAQSIKASGLIQPIVVRRAGQGYQLWEKGATWPAESWVGKKFLRL